jgi:hypothetical protein
MVKAVLRLWSTTSRLMRAETTMVRLTPALMNLWVSPRRWSAMQSETRVSVTPLGPTLQDPATPALRQG